MVAWQPKATNLLAPIPITYVSRYHHSTDEVSVRIPDFLQVLMNGSVLAKCTCDLVGYRLQKSFIPCVLLSIP